jgi:ribosomal protein L37AE/L43A
MIYGRKMMSKHRPECIECGELFQHERKAIGYDTCTSCGDEDARLVKHTIVPMHKSNYVVVSDKADLKGINNNKGGFYR